MKASFDDLTGKQLGVYRIVAQVGAGGMAAVYKAYQPSMDRYVAVKVLPRAMASDPQFTGRFENEARMLARLQHPNILPVFDFGQAEGYAYFVMPLVETGTLAQRLHGQPVPVSQLLDFVTEIGDALDYAHSRGLLHRDIKPSNVLVDEREHYLLTDFGIAKLMDGTSNLTATGTLIGTPAYMSPEQGQGRNLDRRSDLYSLGVIVYEMATGQVPFTADTPVALIFKHVTEPLPPAESLNPSLSPALVQVINRALAKQPEDRFQSGREMVDAVEASIDEPATPRAYAPTMLEYEPRAPGTAAGAPVPAYTNNVPPPVMTPRPGTMAPPGGPPTPPPSLVGAAPLSLNVPPARRGWLAPVLGLGGIGVIGLVVLALVGCGALYVFFPQVLGLPANRAATPTHPAAAATATARPARTATDTPEDEPTAKPSKTPKPATETPVAIEITPVDIFGNDGSFSDDFQDSDSGWTVQSDDSAVIDYVDGELSFQILQTGQFAFSNAPAGDFTSVHLAVNASVVGTPKDAPAMGFICDWQADGAFYFLGISEDGYYGIVYFDGDNVTFLTNDKKEYSPTEAISKYAGAYTLEADCLEDGTLALYVDGHEIARAVDTNLGPGGIGLYSSAFDEAPVEVRFDALEATAVGEGDLLFHDDFESGSGDWWTGGNEQHEIAYSEGAYDIQIFAENLIGWGNPGIDVSDVHIETTVSNFNGTTTAGFGIICDYDPDSGQYYYLGFGGDGYYGIGFFDGNLGGLLTDPDNNWLKSDDIATGQSEYTVGADCAADGTLTLYADGVEIASVQDDRLSAGGDIGMFVESFTTVPVEAWFDDVFVNALP